MNKFKEMYAEVDIVEYAVWCARKSSLRVTPNIDEYLKEIGTSNMINSLKNYNMKSSKMYIKIKPGSCLKFQTETSKNESFIKAFNEFAKIE